VRACVGFGWHIGWGANCIGRWISTYIEERISPSLYKTAPLHAVGVEDTVRKFVEKEGRESCEGMKIDF